VAKRPSLSEEVPKCLRFSSAVTRASSHLRPTAWLFHPKVEWCTPIARHAGPDADLAREREQAQAKAEEHVIMRHRAHLA
jgi:hypothetical protein